MTDPIETTFRDVYGQAVATLVRVFGDISVAEDAVQDAFTIAAQRWPNEGTPPNPAGWIITTARRRAIDDARRASRGRELIEQLDQPELPEPPNLEEPAVPDDQLRLIFTCCHPALRREHQVALTLRLLGGLDVAEIARSFFVSEGAMARRITRAKYKITAAAIPYRIPSDAELPDRLTPVLAVLYLIYNTGFDDETRIELRGDAIRLARVLASLMPDEPEVAGILALMLLIESRSAARRADARNSVLEQQDRTLWDSALIAEGAAIVRACIRRDRPGPYQLQAAIQAVHWSAPTFPDTDWAQIVAIYDHLATIAPTPVVFLNRAIAIGEVDGPDAMLAAVDSLDLDDYHLFHAARGHALRALDRAGEARLAITRAIELAPTTVERLSLEDELATIG